MSNIKAVYRAILSVDEDRTVCATLQMIEEKYGAEFELAFANDGDQNNDTIPVRPICITFIDGLGDKIQSSSWLLG